jgi:hypothetical protein
MIRPLLFAIALTLPLAATARIERSLEPVYASASQYTASLSAARQVWRITPQDGPDAEYRADTLCPHSATPAKGLWLLGRDAEGRAERVAVSATLLPEGHSGRVALRDCDDPALNDAAHPAYGVPAPVLAMLVEHSGAVLVDD